VLTQEALNPFIECTFGLLAVECLSITFQTRPEARDRAYLISPGLSELAESLRVITVSEGLKTHVAVTGNVVTKSGPNALNRGAETRGSVYGLRTPHPAMVVQRT
jgi:hypothetical protein